MEGPIPFVTFAINASSNDKPSFFDSATYAAIFSSNLLIMYVSDLIVVS